MPAVVTLRSPLLDAATVPVTIAVNALLPAAGGKPSRAAERLHLEPT